MAEKQKPKQYKLKEVCIRLAEGHPLYSDQPLSTPAAALDVMRREMSQYDREVLCVVNMNARLQPINFNVVSEMIIVMRILFPIKLLMTI